MSLSREELKVLGTYQFKKTKQKVIVLHIGERSVFYRIYNSKNPDEEVCARINEFLNCFEPVSKVMKKYWLWDVRINSLGPIYKEKHYLDEDGYYTDNMSRYKLECLIRKHENEFIEIEVVL